MVASHISAVRQEYPKQLWYFVASGIALFVLANFWANLRRHARRSTLIAKPLSYNSTNIYTGPISWRRLPVAIGSAWNIAAYRWTVPYGKNHILSLTELGVTILYAGAVLTWSFVNCQSHPPHDIQSGTHADFFLSSQ
jgi:ferric-chelate reductase